MRTQENTFTYGLWNYPYNVRNGVSGRDILRGNKMEFANDMIYVNFKKGYKGVSQKDFYTVKTTDNDF